MSEATPKLVGPDGRPVSSALYGRFLQGSNRNSANVPPLPDFYKDFVKLVSKSDHAAICSNAAMVANNFGPVRSIIEDRAALAVNRALNPSFSGMDKVWGAKAKPILLRFWQNFEMRGHPYDATTCFFLLLVAIGKTGDCGVLYTYDDFGRPRIQMIPGHRIGHRDGNIRTEVRDGIFKGMISENGVISNRLGVVVGYSILGEKAEDDRVVTRSQFDHLYDPSFLDQSRGLPLIYSDVEAGRGILHASRLEMHASLALSALVLVHKNKTGTFEQGLDDTTVGGSAAPTGEQNPTTYEQHMSGLIQYIDSDEDIKVLDHRKPSAEWRALQDKLFAAVCAGAGWDAEFVQSGTTSLTGPRVRMLEDKLNRSILDAYSMVYRVAYRSTLHCISHAIATGELEAHPEWMSWKYSRPAKLTIDAGRANQETRERIRVGLSSFQRALDEEGLGEYRDLAFERAEESIIRQIAIEETEAKYGGRYKIDPREISQWSPNEMPQAEEPDGDEPPDDGKKKKQEENDK